MLSEEEVALWLARRKEAFDTWQAKSKECAADYAEAASDIDVVRTFSTIRATDIVQCVEAGMRQKNIGLKWSISTGRVNQILARFRRQEKVRDERMVEWEAWRVRQELEDQEAAARCPPHLSAVYHQRWDESLFSPRASNALRAAKLTYAWELAETPITWLANRPGVGKKTLQEFQDYLKMLQEEDNDRA